MSNDLEERQMAYLRQLALECVADWCKKAVEKKRPLTLVEIYNYMAPPDENIKDMDDLEMNGHPPLVLSAMGLKTRLDGLYSDFGWMKLKEEE